MQANSLVNRSAPAKLAGSGLLYFFGRRRRRAINGSIKPGSKAKLAVQAHAATKPGAVVKIRFYLSVALVYSSTLLFAWYIFSPDTFLLRQKPPVSAAAVTPAVTQQPAPAPRTVISGKPVRIVVPRLGINLLVEDGNYDSVKHTWTLSPGNAHFATPSMPPNDYQGNTLIYGHNHDLVLGRLRGSAVGDIAQVFTENGPTFIYSFTNFENVKPDNMSVFKYQGPPTLVIQTCTGNWNETRGLYNFKFERVE